MSRAFVKEDVDEPEASGRSRSASGLPPGALNYMTARGAEQLRGKVAILRDRGDTQGAADLVEILASATVVNPPAVPVESVTFGATVLLRTVDGRTRTVRIVGVDEVDLEPDSVSWVSPPGRALLGVEVGGKAALDGGGPMATVVKVEHR